MLGAVTLAMAEACVIRQYAICHMQGLSGNSDTIPDIVIHGHSHKYGVIKEGKILFLNPGSAGPARFKLPRTAAILELQPKVNSCM